MWRVEIGAESKWRSVLRAMFTVDPRAVSACRIALALTLLADLGIRAGDIEAHYTSRGILPLPIWQTAYQSISPFCFFGFLDDPTAIRIFFLLGALFYLLLLIGRWTRAVSFLSWYFLLSLQQRNPLILNSGDLLLHLLLFWGIFVPLDGQWSVDRRPGARRPLLSVATATVLLQICYVYWSTAYWKSNADWWSEGDALSSALSFELYATGVGNFLLQYPEMLKVMARAILVFEWVAPGLVLISSFDWRVRTALVTLFLGMHLTLIPIFTLGLFPFVSIAGWLLFLPAELWDRLFGPLESREVAVPRVRWSFLLLALLAVSCIAGLPGAEVTSNADLTPIHRGLVRIGVIQSWKMYARPSRDDGWFEVVGTDINGESWDLVRKTRGFEPGKANKGPFIYSNHRWRKYMNRLRKNQDAEVTRLYAEWQCRAASAYLPPGVKLTKVRVSFIIEFGTPPPALRRFTRPPTLERPLGEFTCGV